MYMANSRYIFICLILITFWGCKDLLNTKPQQSIEQQLALNTPQNVKQVLVGAYDNLGNDDMFGGLIYMFPDLMGVGKEAQWTGTYLSYGQIYNKNIPVSNGNVSQAWLEGYNVINITNNVLSALDVVNKSDRDRIEGEAKFIRAITYFQLVRLFAKDYNDGVSSKNMGVPLKLEPTKTINGDNIARNSVQEVYEQIINDLKTAKNRLKQHPPSHIYADTYAASAFLARVYLQQGKYNLARDEANRVITKGPYSLVSNYADAFNNSNVNTSEDIFAMQVTSQDGTNSLQTFYASQENGGRADIEIQQAHLELYKNGDKRYELFYQDNGEVRTGKWKNQYGNVNLIRLAEMYLIRAEGNKRLNESVGDTPTEDINTIRERAGLAALIDPVSLEKILTERHIELAFEGHFLFDLKRTKSTVGGISWDSPRFVYPIPQREMVVNPKLKQNPGYGGG
jgi:hypothetical protein